ncbi:Glutathione S-transferase [Aphelenchoides fujianensis]|nr:Glutathione S-transferase [Aphelenchoides fujianensis]
MSMKLYYFDVRNLAEMSRMILHYGNVPFEDVRVDQSEWPELKTKMLYGKLPLLEVHGKQLGESCAIARYLARKQGETPLVSAHFFHLQVSPERTSGHKRKWTS